MRIEIDFFILLRQYDNCVTNVNILRVKNLHTDKVSSKATVTKPGWFDFCIHYIFIIGNIRPFKQPLCAMLVVARIIMLQ